MLTADTITDEQIRDLRREVMQEWTRRGKTTAWPEGRLILDDTIEALRVYRDGIAANTRLAARGRLAAIILARGK